METDTRRGDAERRPPLTFNLRPGRVLRLPSASCCSRPREHGGLCAGEMPLAGHRAVDAFGCDVRAFVSELQVRPSGRTRQLQRRAGDRSTLCARALEELSTGAVLKRVRGDAAHTVKVISRQRCETRARGVSRLV